MARAEPSQNSCPSDFSWKRMPCRSTIATRSCGVQLPRAERQKSGFSDKNRAGVVPVLVKLQRPPPEIRILAPTWGA